jgi:hypothetical protein
MAKRIEGRTAEETVEITVQVLGVSRAEAETIIAIESGESEGDAIELSPDEDSE